MTEPVVITAGGASATPSNNSSSNKSNTKTKRRHRSRRKNKKRGDGKEQQQVNDQQQPRKEDNIVQLEAGVHDTPVVGVSSTASSSTSASSTKRLENRPDDARREPSQVVVTSPNNPNQPAAEAPMQNKSDRNKRTSKSPKASSSAVSMDQFYDRKTAQMAGDGSGDPNGDADGAANPALVRNIWLMVCFFGIMVSFVVYGLLLEYATSGDNTLHELSFLFVTSGLYTLTAAAGRYVRDEKPTSIPPARFAVLGLTSMGSTFCSVRSLRYVIYPIQVLAKSCKPVPVMIMGAFMGKKYPARKYLNVCLIVLGVALFMGG